MHGSAIYNPHANATPSQRLAISAYNMRRARIAAKALDENATPKIVTFEIPNTPFGVAKVRPFQPDRKPEPAPIYRMWFEDLIAEAERHIQKVRIPAILNATALHFGLSRADLARGGRTKGFVLARHVAMYLAATLTEHSLPEIGRRFGGYDHTSILHGRDRIKHLLKKDPEIAAHVDAITRSIPGAKVSHG